MHFDYSGLPDRPALRVAYAEGLALCRLQARRRSAADPRRDAMAEGAHLFLCGPLAMARVLDDTVPGASDALIAAALTLPWWKDPLVRGAAAEDRPVLAARDMSRLTVAAAIAALQDMTAHPTRYSMAEQAERLEILEDRVAAAGGADAALEQRFIALVRDLRGLPTQPEDVRRPAARQPQPALA